MIRQLPLKRAVLSDDLDMKARYYPGSALTSTGKPAEAVSILEELPEIDARWLVQRDARISADYKAVLKRARAERANSIRLAISQISSSGPEFLCFGVLQ